MNQKITFVLLSIFIGLNTVASSKATAQSDSPSIPEIEWNDTLKRFQFDSEKFIGQRFTAKCPPAAVNQSYTGVYGTDIYPSDNSICTAALHAGKITTEGGVVTVQLNPGGADYTGSTRNGVETGSLPPTQRSMTFIDGSSSTETDQIHLSYIPRIDWDTTFTGSGFAYQQLIGQRFTFNCPTVPHDFRSVTIYGTDSYKYNSFICPAAVHAGAITTEGGMVTVQIDPAISNLVGSIRNGVETRNGSGTNRTISFVDNPVQQ